jgi:ABC-type polysaccharide/polyol phosphate transport system ATPase subunit
MSYNKLAATSRSDEVAVSVRNVSKKFRLFDSHGDRLKEALHPFRKTYHHDFWALNDVNFDVRKGEIIGIMGRNGSGKSTLLQMICGVMQPTHGEIKTKGRISALLELGAGFNPEFTGRANVILNGAIMGFGADEMKQRMPEIEAFADVGDFFDQPVKTYSSGMFVRVAFAAAINIDPEILIVDEALSVGDAKFQHKCYNKIEGFRKAGKTILLVTHDIGQITAHCNRAILIDRSHMLMDGPPRDVVDKYVEMLFADQPTKMNSVDTSSSSSEIKSDANVLFDDNNILNALHGHRLEDRGYFCSGTARYGDGSAVIEDCVFENDGKINPPQIRCGSELAIHFKVKFKKNMIPFYGFAMKNKAGIEIYGSNTFMQRKKQTPVKEGDVRIVTFRFSAPLPLGEYFFDLGVGTPDGTDGGIAADTRRSVVMIRLYSETRSTYNGVLDLNPKLESVPV